MNEGSTVGLPSDDGQNLYHPEDVITPSVAPAATTAPVTVSDQSPTVQVTASDPQPASVVPAQPAATANPTPEPPAALADSQSPITWTASEFVVNQKSGRWYAMLGLAAAIIGAIVWLLTRDLFPTIAVLIGVVLLGYYAGRQPREQTYALDDQGLTVSGRHMSYHEFRSFTVAQEGAFLSIELTPLKRFAVETTIYVDPQDEDRILDRLSQHLPMEEAKATFTDNLMRRIKF